ncbi:MAG: hypothetical protein QGI11_01490 [Nitrospinota bacterium]|jgi:hypothetical protein|nr:hypothetical protein [Nitrospinota bacterium]
MRRAALRRTGWAAVALTVFLVISPFPAGPAPATGRTTLILPDAGRKTFFIRLSDGRGFAVDASRRSRARFDTWGRVLAPLLRNQGERDWAGLFLLARTAITLRTEIMPRAATIPRAAIMPRAAARARKTQPSGQPGPARPAFRS